MNIHKPFLYYPYYGSFRPMLEFLQNELRIHIVAVYFELLLQPRGRDSAALLTYLFYKGN